ncbi:MULTISPECIES: FAD-dependent monooxygenase [Azorhizobium]|uniref:FAD-dependent monooxygenase n=1 Tax=Azorhizobium TaxID=6 RepID=UPI001061382E|nr:FAD-dependent monooxygenase [Azorhizobium sp. AG788]TDU01128.1 salicylate hydroxylase [Azorhizobium sp. AG788]
MGQTSPASALIVGAGIGGLACGIALRRAGLAVRMVEQADELAEVGAGLQLTPNATRHLRDFGVLDALETVAVKPRALEVRDGQTFGLLARCDYAPAVAKYGAPFLVLHRADLQKALADGAKAAGCDILLGARLQSLDTHGDNLRAVAEQEAGLIAETADIVIGADGVRSLVREHLQVGVRPSFARRVAYRATIPVRADTPPDVRLFLGPDAHLVTYPIRAGAAVNVVAIVRQDRPVNRWSEPGDASTVHEAFSQWAPEVRSLLLDASSFLCWGLYDVDPLPRWGAGRTTLLGDAAHAMLPFLAQGAAQAIEDAATLGSVLGAGGPVEPALRRYEALRQARAARVQRGARRNAVIYHLKGPARFARDLALRATGGSLLSRYDWLYGG